MTVAELCEKLGLESILLPDPQRDVRGAYAGDLLSWVMGRAEEDNVWVTIMSNVNVVAVASLAGVSCVIFSEGVRPDGAALEKASQEGVNLLASDDNTYGVCAKLSAVL